MPGLLWDFSVPPDKSQHLAAAFYIFFKLLEPNRLIQRGLNAVIESLGE
jgi:hypothetical protein